MLQGRFDKQGTRIKTALNLRALLGNPEGVNCAGPDFFGDPCFYVLGCRLTKSYPPSEGGIKLSTPDANTARVGPISAA